MRNYIYTAVTPWTRAPLTRNTVQGKPTLSQGERETEVSPRAAEEA